MGSLKLPKLGMVAVGTLIVSVAVGAAVSVLIMVLPTPPPAERPARSPLTGSQTPKTIVYYGDSRESESRRVRTEVFQWERRFPAVSRSNLIVRYRKDDERANVHVVEHSEFPHLAEQRKVTSFPCWVFLIDGREVRRHYGFLNADEVREFWREKSRTTQRTLNL